MTAIELAAWRVSLPLLKRIVSVPHLAERMWSAPGELRPGEPQAAFRRAMDLARRGGRLLSTNCLERSLVLYRLLSKAGVRPTLVLGIRRGGALAGHAWVEVDGEPLGEPSADDYERVTAFGEGGRTVPPRTRVRFR